MLAGTVDLTHYAAAMQLPTWEAASGLVGRGKRFGALAAFELLRDEPIDGERSLLFRARHESATLYVRFSLEAVGGRGARNSKISRVVWWHV